MSDDIPHNYRLVSAVGLERQQKGTRTQTVNIGGQIAKSSTLAEYSWVRVTGDDFMSMNWRELEHVAKLLKAVEGTWISSLKGNHRPSGPTDIKHIQKLYAKAVDARRKAKEATK